ncbi:hypothetical protein BC828DRAFT_388216 [Blastocladiella britannica]|nr:hypothetical protein BC828DRAFT_388216 [Blastocladiella britannica]
MSRLLTRRTLAPLLQKRFIAGSAAVAETCGRETQPLLAGHSLAYQYLGANVPYQRALQIQHATVRALQAQGPAAVESGPEFSNRGAVPNVMYLLQHAPVYTAGRRIKGTDATEGNRLRDLGAEYYEVQRGGETTYHGPGQLIGYPILNLKSLSLSVRCYVSLLERGLIRACHDGFGLTDATTSPHTGVWCGDNKIAALGVHVSRYVTIHGFALNVTCEPLPWFEHIVPCGIVGKGVTSVAKELERRMNITKGMEVDVVGDAIPSVLDGFSTEWGVQWSKCEKSHPEWSEQVRRWVRDGVPGQF